MQIKDVHVWKHIQFSEQWERCSTSRLDALFPSWRRKRENLKENANEYVVFMNRLKRQHAIETGIVEKLYDLSEGITETFIKEGFVESYLQHGDTNIPPGQLMAYLQDNFEAIDFVFDVVKNNRPLTKSFIKELHQLVTRHQHVAEGRGQFGNRLQIPLLKGKFKEWENNPTRSDGTRFIYCPPIHVEAEMDRLVEILTDLETREVKPVLIATWLHHAFVIIHPFQDGNGRMARLLASLVLVKYGLFPLTVKRNEKKRYIDALEMADRDEPQELVDYFSEIQKRNIEAALNLKIEVELSSTSLMEIAEILSQKMEIEKQHREVEKARHQLMAQKRGVILNHCTLILNEIKKDLDNKINGGARISITSSKSVTAQSDTSAKIFTTYAQQHGYILNLDLPSAGFKFRIELPKNRIYELVISLHHFGNDDSTLAIASKLRRNGATISLPIEPYTISLESDLSVLREAFDDIKTYLQNILTLTLAQIASEIA